MPSNYPPGVTGSEPEINGDGAWEVLHEQIDSYCAKAGLSDMDAWVIWVIGCAAYDNAKQLGARFPHDNPE